MSTSLSKVPQERDFASNETAFAASFTGTSMRRVLLDGQVLALECQKLAVWEFVAAGFPECYLETDDGSISAFFLHEKRLDLEIAGPRSSQSVLRQPEYLDPDQWLWTELRIGEPLNLGRGATSVLTRIIVVTSTSVDSNSSLPNEDMRLRFKTLRTTSLHSR